MHERSTTSKQNVMIRIPGALHAQVKAIAQRESEAQSTILRRLLRRGLALEQRAEHGE